jgi:hypothetical protein
MNSFTRTSISALRTDLENAIKQVADKHNLIIGFVGGARFSPTEVNFSKLRAIPKAPPTLQTSWRNPVAGNAVTKGTDPYDTLESREYTSLGYTFGLSKDWLGKKFRTATGVYTLIGLKASRPKYPVIGVSVRGTRYKFTVAGVKQGIIL